MQTVKNAFKLNAFTVLGLCISVTMLYFLRQPQIVAGAGMGWDGIDYHRLYNHIKGLDTDTAVAYPFCKRIALPYVAALLPLAAEKAFLLVNIASGITGVLFCYLALRDRYNGLTIIACLTPIIFYLFSPLRFPYFYPFTVDPPAFCLYAIAIFFLSRGVPWGAVISLTISGFFREPGFYFAIALIMLLLQNRLRRKDGLLMASFCFGGLALAYALQDKPCSGSQLMVAISSIYLKFSNPVGWVKFIAALLLTCGAFIIRSYNSNGKQAPTRFFELNNCSDVIIISCAMLLISILMAAAGGTDSTRIFFVSYPLYITFLASCIDNRGWLEVSVASVWGLIANRFTTKILEPTSYWPRNDEDGFFSFFPDHGNIDVAIVILTYWSITHFVLMYISRRNISEISLRTLKGFWSKSTPSSFE
ncbi:MAG: hypothetical protein WA733_05055 [Methylocystis sp.]